MELNQFLKMVEKDIPDPRMRHAMSILFERQTAIHQDLDQMATLCLGLAQSIQGVLKLNEDTRAALAATERRGMSEHAEVHSVLVEPK